MLRQYPATALCTASSSHHLHLFRAGNLRDGLDDETKSGKADFVIMRVIRSGGYKRGLQLVSLALSGHRTVREHEKSRGHLIDASNAIDCEHSQDGQVKVKELIATPCRRQLGY